jgi:hypothetical protein
VTSPINDDHQQQLRHSKLTKRASPLENILHLPDAFGNLVGNILTDTHDVLDKINPLKHIFSRNIPPVTGKNPAETTADSFKGKPIRRMTTPTIPKNTKSVHGDPLGNLLKGAEGVFDTALGIKPRTTTSAQTGTTVAPPPGGHGRGVPAIFFNIKNIIQNILSVVGAILHWGEHSEPGYIMSKIQSSMQSVEALVDIYLQRNMEGGIEDIPKHVWAILNSIGSLSGTLKHNDILALVGTGQTLLRNFGKLKDDFIEPVSTTPVPGGLIGGLLRGLSVIIPHNNPHTHKETNQTSLQQTYGAFGNVVWNTGELIDALKDIDETIEEHHPNNTILQFIEKVEESAELSLINNTLDDENILDVIQKVWFPDMTLAQMIGNFGKTLKQVFPKFGIAQIVGDLLQQKIFVDIGLNILIRGINFLQFGNIKHDFLQAVGNISDIVLGRDLNGLLADGIEILVKIAETVEWFLKSYRIILHRLILSLEGGVDQRHATKEGALDPKINSTRNHGYSDIARYTMGHTT